MGVSRQNTNSTVQDLHNATFQPCKAPNMDDNADMGTNPDNCECSAAQDNHDWDDLHPNHSLHPRIRPTTGQSDQCLPGPADSL